MPPDEPEIPDIMYSYPVKLINMFDHFDESERKSGADLALQGENKNKWPSVLIFLPGIQEIHFMQKTLENQWNRM